MRRERPDPPTASQPSTRGRAFDGGPVIDLRDLPGPDADGANGLAAPPEVRRARADELGDIIQCLARAFFDDPVACFLFPAPESRLRRLRAFYAANLPGLLGGGATFVDDGLRGAVLCQAPSPPRLGPLRTALVSVRMAATLRGSLPRAVRLNDALLARHPRSRHWYLAVLGTEPDCQGRGIGGALVEAVARSADEDRVPTYLESSKEANIPFYERHGFRVADEIRVADGPLLWPMLRPVAGID